MSHTYHSCLYHFVFSTTRREMLIGTEWMERLWEYMGGVAREADMKAICIGGTENHAHALLAMKPTMAPAKGIQIIKGNSSKWVNDTIDPRFYFGWQEGYGVFTISVSHRAKTEEYIRG